jgi:hypothetical protein
MFYGWSRDIHRYSQTAVSEFIGGADLNKGGIESDAMAGKHSGNLGKMRMDWLIKNNFRENRRVKDASSTNWDRVEDSI